jgi:hypothetical protein
MGRIKTGTDYNGVSNAFGRGNEKRLSVHHDPNEARRGDMPGEGLARNGAAKKLHPVSLHNSATPHQIAGIDAGGQGHPVAVVDCGVKLTSSSAAAPLANGYGGMVPKVREAAPIKPGMKSQQGD